MGEKTKLKYYVLSCCCDRYVTLSRYCIQCVYVHYIVNQDIVTIRMVII